VCFPSDTHHTSTPSHLAIMAANWRVCEGTLSTFLVHSKSPDGVREVPASTLTGLRRASVLRVLAQQKIEAEQVSRCEDVWLVTIEAMKGRDERVVLVRS